MILNFITNNPALAQEADQSGVERIMIDLERKNKAIRQSGKDLFLSDHSMQDLPKIKSVLRNAGLMVRINSLDADSKQEIDEVIALGADYIMLPYFHSKEEAALFCSYVNGRAQTSLLVETAEAAKQIHELAAMPVHEIHIGLNDLQISMNFKSIFEPVHNGFIEQLCQVLQQSGKQYGFGGIGRIARNDLPISPERILAEQVRLGCNIGWLGRTFRQNMEETLNPEEVKNELAHLRAAISKWRAASFSDFELNKKILFEEIKAWEMQLSGTPYSNNY